MYMYMYRDSYPEPCYTYCWLLWVPVLPSKIPLCLHYDYSECLCCIQKFLCVCFVTCSSSLSLLSEKSLKGILTQTVAQKVSRGSWHRWLLKKSQEDLVMDGCSKRIAVTPGIENMYQTTSTNEWSASRQTDSTDRFHSNMYKKQVHCSYMYMYIMLCCNTYDLNSKSGFCTKKHYQSFTLCTLRYFSHALFQSFK